MSNAETVTPIKPAAREKSRETILKQELRIVRKEMVKLDKKAEQFKALKDEMKTVETDLEKLQVTEATIKSDLIQLLDLA